MLATTLHHATPLHSTPRHATPHDDSLAFIMQLFPNYTSVRLFFLRYLAQYPLPCLMRCLLKSLTTQTHLYSLHLISFLPPPNESVLRSRLLFQDANINCTNLLIWDAKFSIRLPFPSLISIVFLLQFMVFFFLSLAIFSGYFRY